MGDFRYRQIRNALFERVSQGLRPGTRLPSLKGLSREYGVSRNTVQRAVDDLVAEQVLTKRRGSGIYVADPKARTLRIGFIYPWTMQQLHSYQWHHDLILHVEEEITRHGHELIVSCNVGREQDSDAPESFRRALYTLDGVLFFNMYNNKIVQDVADRAIPVIVLHHVRPIYNVYRIEADGAGGMRQATRHLIGLGHRRVAFLTDRSKMRGRRHVLFENREEGWREALKEAGLACDDSLILQAPPAEWDEPCMADFRRMVGGPEPVTAVVCINDIAASYLYKAAHSLGLRVPRDLSVVGCENTPLSDLLNPRITSVDIPQDKIARFAVEKLLRLIHQGERDQLMHVFRTRLVVKESTGPAKQAMGTSLGETAPPPSETSVALAVQPGVPA